MTRILPTLARTILTVFCAALLNEATAAGFQLSAAARKELEAEAQRMIDERRAPGLAIGIMSEGRIVYAKGFGLANLETGTKVMPDSVFAIGSITKQFTAAAIVLLSEQGKLAIDDPLSKYFPAFPKAEQVTLRHLLTHRSGIHPVMIPGGLPTPEQRVALSSARDLVPIIQGQVNLYDFEPGTSTRYSNSGYILLGVIIEKVSGLTLGQFFKHHLFDRAGMTASAMDNATEVVPNRASGYNREPGGSDFIHPPNLRDIGTGGGGIRSTIGDMLRWQDALLSGRIISLESVQAIATPGGRNAGLFGMTAGDPNGRIVLGSGGGGPGFRSTLKIFPDDRVAFVVLANAGAPQVQRPASELGEAAPVKKEVPRGNDAPRKKIKGPGKKSRQSAQNQPDAVREIEAVLTRLMTGNQ